MREKLLPLDDWIQEREKISPWSRKQLRNWQLQQIQRLWSYVQEASPGYRRLYENTSFPGSWEAFGQLPFITGEDLKEGGPNLLCVSQGQVKRVVTLTTSGTTGEPKRLYFTGEDQERTVDFFANGMKMLTRRGETVMILLPCSPVGGVGDLLRQGLLRLPARPVCYGLVENLADCLEVMRREKPQVLVGIPTQILSLAQYAAKEGWESSVQRILCSTDILSKALRKRIEALWTCEVYDHFGITEAGLGGALECDKHWGMHIREQDLYLEIIDPKTGRVLPSGEPGELVLTTLTRSGMPLIRYRTGDLARIEDGICPCGSILRRLFGPWARIDAAREGLCIGALDEVIFQMEDLVEYEASLDVDILKLKMYTLNNEGMQKLRSQIPFLRRAVLSQAEEAGWNLKEVSFEVHLRPLSYPYRGKRRIVRRGMNADLFDSSR